MDEDNSDWKSVSKYLRFCCNAFSYYFFLVIQHELREWRNEWDVVKRFQAPRDEEFDRMENHFKLCRFHMQNDFVKALDPAVATPGYVRDRDGDKTPFSWIWDRKRHVAGKQLDRTDDDNLRTEAGVEDGKKLESEEGKPRDGDNDNCEVGGQRGPFSFPKDEMHNSFCTMGLDEGKNKPVPGGAESGVEA